MGLVMGLFFFVSGHFVLSFAANIICGVAADLVAAAGKYRSKKLLLATVGILLLVHNDGVLADYRVSLRLIILCEFFDIFTDLLRILCLGSSETNHCRSFFLC